MLIFSFPSQRNLADSLLKQAGHKPGNFTVARYENGELYLTLKTKVHDKVCLIIGETTPPDNNILELLMLADTLRQEGARKIIVFAPYLGYSRQEHPIKNVARNTYLMGKMLKVAGVSELVTIDLHNPQIMADFPIKIVNLPARPIFAHILKKLEHKDITLIAPDDGAIERCRTLETDWPIAYFEKTRLAKIIKLDKLRGQITPEVVICDDILGTGQTLVLAVKKLHRLGIDKITILVTHSQFSDKTWRELLRRNIIIYTSDSCLEARKQRGRKIKILPTLPAIQQYFHHYL